VKDWTSIPGRRTKFMGKQMRSRLEADFAASLEREKEEWGTDWAYEPVCFGSGDGQWLPDFSRSYGGSVTYIEVKPLGMFVTLVEYSRTSEIDDLLRKMSVAWASEPDAGLDLVFWEYEAKTAPVLVTATQSGAPWLVFEHGARWPHGYLWTGMGQWTACRGSHD
jgi:hypothetical protein